MIEHILTYLIFGSLVLFFEVIFPYGFLMLAALGFYGIAIFKAWVHFGVTGAVATLITAIVFAGVTAYWELRMLPRHTLLARFPWLRDRISSRFAPKAAETTPELKNQIGVTLTPLNPAGHVEIAGRSYVAQVSHGALPQGQPVRVIDVAVHGLRVEKIES